MQRSNDSIIVRHEPRAEIDNSAREAANEAIEERLF